LKTVVYYLFAKEKPSYNAGTRIYSNFYVVIIGLSQYFQFTLKYLKK